MIDYWAIFRSLVDLMAGFLIGYYFLIPLYQFIKNSYGKMRNKNGN